MNKQATIFFLTLKCQDFTLDISPFFLIRVNESYDATYTAYVYLGLQMQSDLIFITDYSSKNLLLPEFNNLSQFAEFVISDIIHLLHQPDYFDWAKLFNLLLHSPAPALDIIEQM